MSDAEIESFGATADGRQVDRIVLQGGGLTAFVLTHGARLQDLRLDGVPYPLVLGAPDLAPYLSHMRSFGAMVGRFANRIGDARFEIDGAAYHTDRNYLAKHTLHGGSGGAGTAVWDIGDVDADRVTLTLRLPDGHMGFPGELSVKVAYALPDDGALHIEISATADAATVCNFAHHSYFNLDGKPHVAAHELEVDAETYLPVDAELIPTGEIAPVAGTRFDFRARRPIGAQDYDCNFCLSRGPRPIRRAARLSGPRSGLTLTVETDAPGLQVYNAAHLPEDRQAGIDGLEGRRYGKYAGLALETQTWPDAPNHPGFPSAVLRPGETYRHTVRYAFGRA